MKNCPHQWVRYTQEMVDAIVDPVDGNVYAVVREGEVGEATGCLICGDPLTAETAGSQCEGAPA